MATVFFCPTSTTSRLAFHPSFRSALNRLNNVLDKAPLATHMAGKANSWSILFRTARVLKNSFRGDDSLIKQFKPNLTRALVVPNSPECWSVFIPRRDSPSTQ
jgi:hypothetical protein